MTASRRLDLVLKVISLAQRRVGWAARQIKSAVKYSVAAVRDIATEVARYWPRALTTFVAGVIVLLLVRYPSLGHSILGAPDRQIVNEAFYLRTDVFVGKGDPVLLLDIDNATIAQIAAPDRGSTSVPPGLLADLFQWILSAPPGRGAKVVMLAVESAKGDEDGEAPLRKAFADWAANPQAPTLVIPRRTLPSELFGDSGSVPVLATSDYDGISPRRPTSIWARQGR